MQTAVLTVLVFPVRLSTSLALQDAPIKIKTCQMALGIIAIVVAMGVYMSLPRCNYLEPAEHGSKCLTGFCWQNSRSTGSRNRNYPAILPSEKNSSFTMLACRDACIQCPAIRVLVATIAVVHDYLMLFELLLLHDYATILHLIVWSGFVKCNGAQSS